MSELSKKINKKKKTKQKTLQLPKHKYLFYIFSFVL